MEAVAWSCAYCQDWSAYKKEYNEKLPRGWRLAEKGHQCNDCRKKPSNNVSANSKEN